MIRTDFPSVKWEPLSEHTEQFGGHIAGSISHIVQVPTVRVAPDGFVRLIRNLGDDDLIVECARIGRDSTTSTESLIRYMMRHAHTSPFEFVKFVFHVRLPIFVARQWMRHRTGTFNEWSGRYMELPEALWQPAAWRAQSKSNRQGSSDETLPMFRPREYLMLQSTDATYVQDFNEKTVEEAAFDEYQHRLRMGVSKEQARTCLPVSAYTEFYWTVDLHNLLHFLDLRCETHAQLEMQEYAMALQAFVAKTVPITYAAWLDYRANAMTLTAAEIKMARGEPVKFTSQREADEAAEKMRRLGLPVVHLDDSLNIVQIIKEAEKA